jgi:uncharacterized protein YrrD
MLVKGKDVIGLKVVTIDNGTVIETVDDIAFNPSTHRVEALLVSSGGLFSSAKAILMDDVRNIGEDAVVVPDADVIKSIKELGDAVSSIADSNKHLVKTNVLTVDGKELGKVTDIFFDSATGDVDSMEVSQGGLKTITEGKKSIKPADIVTIGADATIVSAYTELKLEEQGEAGGLKGAFNDVKDKAEDLATQAKETAEDTAHTVKAKSVELKDAAQDKAADAKDSFDEKSAEARIKAEELREKAADKTDELRDKAAVKAEELRDDAEVKSCEMKVKAEELRDKAEVKGRELQADAKVKAEEVRKQTNERVEDVKEKHGDKIAAVHNQGREVVTQAKKTVEDGAKKVEHEKTKIVKK